MFGRTGELAAIDWLLQSATAGSGRTLVLEGEAGIGKTHLTEIARHAARSLGLKVIAAGADELEHDRAGRVLLGLADAVGLSLDALLGRLPRSQRGLSLSAGRC